MIKTICLSNDERTLSDPGQKEDVMEIAKKISHSLSIIAITGAGISVAAGIPDFRSSSGLYQKAFSPSNSKENSKSGSQDAMPTAQSQKLSNVRGKDLFDAACLNNPLTRPIFYKFIDELKCLADQALPTFTHRFLQQMAISGKLTRWYSQNIDCLEQQHKDMDENKVILLHGSLKEVVCTHCKYTHPYDDSIERFFRNGSTPPCKSCEARCNDRIALGRRPIRSGSMRPNIVLYNELHPDGEAIAEMVWKDTNRPPNVLFVIGTSLKVLGLKRMVKDMAKSVHARNGLVVYVNKTPASRTDWKNVFDVELIGPCDAWFSMLEELISTSVAISKDPRENSKSIGKDHRKNGRIDAMLKTVRKPRISNGSRLEEKH